jgi:hypothetical protein
VLLGEEEVSSPCDGGFYLVESRIDAAKPGYSGLSTFRGCAHADPEVLFQKAAVLRCK